MEPATVFIVSAILLGLFVFFLIFALYTRNAAAIVLLLLITAIIAYGGHSLLVPIRYEPTIPSYESYNLVNLNVAPDGPKIYASRDNQSVSFTYYNGSQEIRQTFPTAFVRIEEFGYNIRPTVHIVGKESLQPVHKFFFWEVRLQKPIVSACAHLHIPQGTVLQ